MTDKTFDISRHISWKTDSKKLIRKSALAKSYNVCVRTIDNRIKSSKLPSPIRRNERVVGWMEDTLAEWFKNNKDL
ncbi:hypothetical protein UA38_06540 [Photobacterium kishitanii]|uniref:AlpA family phage regulatory protein n=1 Tax=Photobacterium kishitanii TaxID=318456 RepID=A0AAX0YU84_9GAMM|nr:hypothetical protein [Photobacterium kishitanii]KJG58539.1 hypothetical protein UA38_06540 [Photobacterium kishitanii]KJG61826.1 hypothetical protein UA42_08645 [Photobacterium kishitanii]KJG66422.1 hypothetical protein UA40_07030 [Photobacterium kishitanii]KJG70089.1 hypothetical protein UA41_08365 [Photobacterium kishitanii]PSX18404.1 hypothetical protein C0W70_14515 [Photobacterium kishitanii]